MEDYDYELAEDFDTDRLDHYLAMYLFEQEVMEEAKKTAERPEEYAQVLAIMWTDTKRELARKCQEAAFEMIEGMFRLQRLGFDRVEEFGAMRKRDRRTARSRHGLEGPPPIYIAPLTPPRLQSPPASAFASAYDDMTDTGFMRAVRRLVDGDPNAAESSGLTVREAARRIGVSVNVIRHWLDGVGLPHLNLRPHALRALRE